MSIHSNVNIGATVLTFIVIIISVIVFIFLSPDSLSRKCALNHNKYRYEHRSPFLTVSQTLVDFAKKRVEEMKSTGTWAKSQNSYGESQFRATFGYEREDKVDCEKISDFWYNESRYYDYEKGETRKGTVIHFTQMVWSDTRRIGCAKAFDQSTGTTHFVCNYEPKGNIDGNYVEKVPKIHKRFVNKN